MFREADKDGDGTMSFSEFKSLLLPEVPKSNQYGFMMDGGEKKKGETQVMRFGGSPEKLVTNFRGMTNLKDIFELNTKTSPQKPFLGTRSKTTGDYHWKTYSEVYDCSKAVADYLIHHEMCPRIENEEGSFRFLGIFSKNREEWAITDFGCIVAGITSVPLYDTLGQESIEYIINQTLLKTVVCSADKIK